MLQIKMITTIKVSDAITHNENSTSFIRIFSSKGAVKSEHFFN